MAAAASFAPMIMQGMGMAADASGGQMSRGQQADKLEYDAKQQVFQAGYISQQSGQTEESQRRSADMQLGAARAAAAQGGTGMDGSAADVVQQSAANAELDALNIRYGGVLKQKAALDQAGLDTWQAGVLRTPTFMDNLLKFGQPKNIFGPVPGVAYSAATGKNLPTVGGQMNPAGRL